MYWELKKRRTAGGFMRKQLYLVHKAGGRRVRIFVKESDAFLLRMQLSAVKAQMPKPPPKPPKPPPRKAGRPRVIPSEMMDVATRAGYTPSGTSLRMSHARFRTLEAATVRFALLDNAARAAVGSPGRLHEATLKAYAVLKSRNRRSIPTSFDECLAEALSAPLNSNC